MRSRIAFIQAGSAPVRKKAMARFTWLQLDAPTRVHNLKRAHGSPPRANLAKILRAFYRSSVGKKMIVAVTGIILILFVIGHLLGNLQIFIGPDWINGYSQHLRDLGPL